jgi:hypothetical protein
MFGLSITMEVAGISADEIGMTAANENGVMRGPSTWEAGYARHLKGLLDERQQHSHLALLTIQKKEQ